MQTKNQNKTSINSRKYKESLSLARKKTFRLLSDSQKSKILKSQAEKLLDYYNQDEKWKEFQALDIKDE